MHDPASELRRIHLPRTSVNKGTWKGRGARPRHIDHHHIPPLYGQRVASIPPLTTLGRNYLLGSSGVGT